jgi:hypothetical protein
MSDDESQSGEDSNENPLFELEVSQDELNRDALLDPLKGRVQIIKESSELQPADGFSDLSNNERFVTLLLARRAADDLGHIDAVGAESNWFTKLIDVNDSRIRQYAGDFDFIKNDSDIGGYHIPGFRINEAVEVIEDG